MASLLVVIAGVITLMTINAVGTDNISWLGVAVLGAGLAQAYVPNCACLERDATYFGGAARSSTYPGAR